MKTEMDWLSIDSLGNIVVPLITFALGVVVTLATQRVERRRSELRDHLSGAVKLVNDWYNQIHELSVGAMFRGNGADTKRAVYAYVHNRLILPSLMLHLEFIRERRAHSELTSAIEDFLALVTTLPLPRPVQPAVPWVDHHSMKCIDLFAKHANEHNPFQEVVGSVGCEASRDHEALRQRPRGLNSTHLQKVYSELPDGYRSSLAAVGRSLRISGQAWESRPADLSGHNPR